MPMYDRICDNGHELIDCWEPIDTPKVLCKVCNAPTKRAWLTKTAAVIGDECDVWIRHGICNDDGTPRHYTSKEEMRKEMKRKGLVNAVRHAPEPGTDKSKHTTRWV